MIEANGTSVAGGVGTDVAPALGDVGVLEAAVDGLRCRDTSNRSSNTCSLVGTGHGHYAKITYLKRVSSSQKLLARFVYKRHALDDAHGLGELSG